MVRQLLLCVGVALGLTAVADVHQSASKAQVVKSVENQMSVLASKAELKPMKLNDGSNKVSTPKGTASLNVHWKRPAGQFWGTGIVPETVSDGSFYYFTPLVLRPWVDYTFENLSTVNSTPTWTVEYYDPEVYASTGEYSSAQSNDQDLTVSYVRYETPAVPKLAYKNLSYPEQYYGDQLTDAQGITILSNNNIDDYFGAKMLVSSHYFSLFTRNAVERAGIIAYTGADAYDGEEYGFWFGTNNSGFNAMATRFEKPDQPYLLNGVYWYYQFEGTIAQNIPLRAYVFKTANDAAPVEVTSSSTGAKIEVETLELGELIAVSDSFIPAGTGDDNYYQNVVRFDFIEKNPVTGAESNVSLEIDDDITVVVTGYDAYAGAGAYVTSCMSADEFDEGYGNLGFLGYFDVAEDGSVEYYMSAISNFFNSTLPKTTLGVLADVSYPWLQNYYINQPSIVKLANDGETTEDVQGLQYDLFLMSTSETDDMDVTFNGEDECEWLSIVGVYDDYDTNSSGEEEFSGIVGLEFEAAPNPNDETRECKVVISIPAATYEITFVQGSKAETKVEVVSAEGEAKYFDLAGRRVVNPDKGIYVKVSGNKSEKVVL